jgi:hypothetical protein
MLEDGAFAAELGLDDGEGAPGFGASFESDLSDLEAMGTGDGDGFAEELASLDVPPADDDKKKE